MHPKNSHARYARFVAERLGWLFTALDGGDAYLFELRDGERRCVLASGPASPYVENPAAAYTLARDKHFTAQALDRAGVPHVPGRLYFTTPRLRAWRAPGQEREDLLREAPALGFPMFCKPNNGCRGEFAEQVDDIAALAGYLDRVATTHETVLVQPVVRADEWRVFVHGGRALFCYRKLGGKLGDPGDGRATPHNRAAGGRTAELGTEVPPALATVALSACRALGLVLAGVDLFVVPDAAGRPEASVVQVIEVNANPMIETLEDHGRWDLIESIWTRNLQAAMAR